MRKIIHIDMDSFFASVEQRDFPEYRGKPLVVGGKSPRSVVAERTYETDIYEMDQVQERLDEVIDIMWRRCEAKQMYGRTFTLKLRFSDFTTITRSSTLDHPFTKPEIDVVLQELVPGNEIHERGVRLLGGTMSHFPMEKREEKTGQLRIDFDGENTM